MPDMPKIGKDCIDLVVAEAHIQDPAGVDLSTYQAIEPRGARHLASHLEGSLLLLGIHSICKESARELSSFQGRISMPELKQFDAETAEVIASFPGVTICNTIGGGKRIGELLGPLDPAKANPVSPSATPSEAGKESGNFSVLSNPRRPTKSSTLPAKSAE